MPRSPRAAAALGLAVAVVGLAVACSGETLPADGALLLSIQTDLSAPKDVASIGLYITSDGRPIFSDTRNVAPNGEVRFPATLAVLADPNRPGAVIKIRAIAFKDTGDVRVLRDIITTVPKGRTALLRAPLLWINEGSGTGNRQALVSGVGTKSSATLHPLDNADGFTLIKSACPEGQTFLEGECGDANVDSSTLPDYQERDVFGGGEASGNGGRCFDVLGCFSSASAVTVDMGACSAPAPGVDPNDPNLSFAVSLPASASTGECRGATCLVPLDKGVGWKPAGAGVTFPRAICARIRSGTALGIVRTTTCAAKDPATPSCGPASSVSTPSSPPVDASIDSPLPTSQDFDTPLAFGDEPNLSAVAIDVDTVYLARTSASPAPPGVVKLARADVVAQKMPAPVSVLFGYAMPQLSALRAGPLPNATKIVARGDQSGQIRVCTPTSNNNCPTVTLMPGPSTLALGPAEAYAYGDTGGPPGIFAIDLTTPVLAPRAEIAGPAVASLLVSAGTLYLGMADGSIQKCAIPCAAAADVSQIRPAPASPSIVTALAADDRVANQLFFMQVPADGTTLAAGGIFEIGTSGAGEQQLATGAEILGAPPPPPAPPGAFAVDSEYVYWGGTFDDPRGGGSKKGLLRRNHVTRAAAEPFLEAAQGTDIASSIAVDGAHVFWTYDRPTTALQFARKKRAF